MDKEKILVVFTLIMVVLSTFMPWFSMLTVEYSGEEFHGYYNLIIALLLLGYVLFSGIFKPFKQIERIIYYSICCVFTLYNFYMFKTYQNEDGLFDLSFLKRIKLPFLDLEKLLTVKTELGIYFLVTGLTVLTLFPFIFYLARKK
ncbi:MAG: hypothetical protein FJX80_03480 [Bacteroidetes bacterium]|nr:hypothetical protein [Bacteroidota bacterium]